jgi:FMN phosphatase YigB (HAD superfamily)
MKIEAVIVDWGGVLIENPAWGLMHYCAGALGVPPDRYAQVHNALAGPFQEGRISEPDFWMGVCRRLSCPLPVSPSLWGDAFRAVYRPRPEMLALVSSLKARGCKTALLSNTEQPCVRYLHELRYDAFDVCIFSCEEGVTKPARRIYDLALERLGVVPGKAVFVDDNALFVAGAREAGLHGIVYSDSLNLAQGLAELMS